MKNRMFIFLGLITISFFSLSSCQKEVDDFFNDNPTADTTWIEQIVSLDTTKRVGEDTVVLSNFQYDAIKRLKSYDFTEFDLGGVRYTSDYRLYYRNNTDTLPYKMTTTYRYATDSIISYYFSKDGFIIRDSIIKFRGGAPDEIEKNIYSSLGGNRYVCKKYFTSLPSGTTYLMDSIVYYRTVAGGNVLSARDSTWDVFSFYQYSTHEQMGYDNKKSYMHRFGFWFLGYYKYLMGEFWPPYGTNNLTSYTRTTDDNPPVNEAFIISYQYNAAGYPLIARIAGNPDVNKIVFKYRRL